MYFFNSFSRAIFNSEVVALWSVPVEQEFEAVHVDVDDHCQQEEASWYKEDPRIDDFRGTISSKFFRCSAEKN